jgi:hypothetical protein
MSRREDFLREVMRQGQEIATLRAALAERDARIAALTELLRETYPYLPLAVSLAEELAEMFPDIARPYDRTYPCTSDQFTHTYHYPHGDEGDA